jgi:small multidrug resistance family-3 protein
VTARSVALFIVAAVAEIGGAYLMWQAIKEDRGLLFALAGAAALVGYGAVAALQPDAHFGRVLAAYGGVFIVGSLLWGMAFDGFRPDRYDIAGAAVCLIGVAVIMYSPRGAT